MGELGCYISKLLLDTNCKLLFLVYNSNNASVKSLKSVQLKYLKLKLVM